jgi:hypothetical protein
MNLPIEHQPDENLPSKTRGWLLVLASCLAILAFLLFRYSPLAGYRWRIARRGVGFSQGANSSSMKIDPLNDD